MTPVERISESASPFPANNNNMLFQHNPVVLNMLTHNPDKDHPPKMSLEDTINLARASFASDITRSYAFRKQQLKNLLRFMEECHEGIIDAVHRDLHKPRGEVIMSEIDLVKNDLKHTLYELKNWMRPEKPERRLVNLLDTIRIYHDPYGVVLIMSAWNYPFLLLLGPLVGAIAAGNCALLKPSELSQHSAQFIFDNLPKYVDPQCYHVVLGGVDFTTELLKHKFDYIMFTGSTMVGRIIHKAAAEHLTPCTLELGGKSPCYIDSDVDIKQAARRVLWGRLLNAGQTCIAPDYVLCGKETEGRFLESAREVLAEFYGDGGDIIKSEDISHIVTQRHFDRLVKFVQSGRIAVGGQTDAATRAIAPTILVDVSPEDAVMQEEIFGPILPVINVESAEEAVEFVRKRDKPLVCYVFTRNSRVKEMFLERTSSGALAVNDTIVQMTTENLPFGGVGHSGMGAYHGRYGFDTFSHKKSVLMKGFGFVSEMMMKPRYPPYTDLKMGFLSGVLAKHRDIVTYSMAKNLVVFGLGVGSAMVFQCLRGYEEDSI